MEKNLKGMCIASMIIGIISILMCAIQPVVIIAAIVGLILGLVALKTTEGKGMAIAGIIMSSLGIILGLLVMTVFMGAVGIVGKSIETFDNNGSNYHYELHDDGFNSNFDIFIDGYDGDDSDDKSPEKDDNLI